jgi:uncharacterized membrane protein YccC
MTNLIMGDTNSGPEFGKGIDSWIFVGLVVPIVETFLNQKLPFVLLQSWNLTKNKYGLYVLLSAILFGLCHTYSVQYLLFAFSVGLILGYTYLFYSKTPKLAFWVTSLIHSLRNLTTLMLIAFTNW